MPKPPSVREVLSSIKGAREAHEERHRPSGFQIALADSIDQLHPVAWDALTASQTLFMQRGYLRIVEQCAPEGLKPRYALVFDKGRAVAALAGQILSITSDRFLQEASNKKETSLRANLKKAAEAFRAKVLEKFELDIFVTGSFYHWGNSGVVFAEGEDPARVWPGVTEAIYRIRRAEALAGQPDFVIIKDVLPQDEGSRGALKRFSYQFYETEPDMVLELPAAWKKFDDYLGALNKKYRKAAKGLDKDLTAAGFKLERVSDLNGHSARIHELHLQVQAHNSMRVILLTPEYLPSLSAFLGERFRCTVVKDGENLAGFVTTVKDGDTAVGYFIGFDYTANERAPIYLRLLQAVVEDAIDLGCRRVSYGRTALEPKARLGAKPVPLGVAIRHRHPVLNALVPNILKALIPHDTAPERNPFKEE
jgi:predicted N-acyltransferase